MPKPQPRRPLSISCTGAIHSLLTPQPAVLVSMSELKGWFHVYHIWEPDLRRRWVLSGYVSVQQSWRLAAQTRFKAEFHDRVLRWDEPINRNLADCKIVVWCYCRDQPHITKTRNGGAGLNNKSFGEGVQHMCGTTKWGVRRTRICGFSMEFWEIAENIRTYSFCCYINLWPSIWCCAWAERFYKAWACPGLWIR